MPALIDAAGRRRELIDAAWRIALDEGLGAATVRRIALAAQLTPSAVQRAFPTHTALHRSLAGEAIRRNRADMQATQGSRPADALMALLPTSHTRREVLALANQMRYSAHIFAEYPIAAAQIRAHLVFFCEHQFRQRAGLPPARPLTGITKMEARRLQAIVDGLTTTLLEDLGTPGEKPNLDLVRGLILQSLPGANE